MRCICRQFCVSLSSSLSPVLPADMTNIFSVMGAIRPQSWVIGDIFSAKGALYYRTLLSQLLASCLPVGCQYCQQIWVSFLVQVRAYASNRWLMSSIFSARCAGYVATLFSHFPATFPPLSRHLGSADMTNIFSASELIWQQHLSHE